MTRCRFKKAWKMRHVNRHIYAREALAWFDQFSKLEEYNQAKQKALRQLGENPNPDEVDRIMGLHWTWTQCCECGGLQDQGVELDVICDEFKAVLCLDCIGKAIRIMDEVME